MKPAYGYIIEKDGVKIGFMILTPFLGQNRNEVFILENYNTIFITSHMDDEVKSLLFELKYNNLIVGEDGMEYFIKEDMY